MTIMLSFVNIALSCQVAAPRLLADRQEVDDATYSQAGQQFGLNTLCDAGRLSSDGGNSTRLDSHHAYGGRSTQNAELRMMVP